ncbi:SGT1 protein-domain-containing protein, partial [Thelephora terrestris]
MIHDHHMDIYNRPPAISEDTVQYRLYPTQQSADKVSALTLATVLKSHADDLLPGFLWHRDPFELKVVSDSSGWLLEGTVRVGDCVDDEWCVVWLLREISKKWDVVISVSDSDGEFLLIEAAEVIPPWVTPSNAENRIWIYNSQLHLIPLSYTSSSSSRPPKRQTPGRNQSDDEGVDFLEDDSYISVKDALKFIRDETVQTRAPSELEDVVWNRISRYPAAATQHTHVTRAWLPTDIAKALRVDPTLVQKPAETFYTRDAIQLRAAHRMSRFPPQPTVLTTVRMTRVAYAQLVGQKFHPTKIWGYWKEKEGTNEWRWRDVGMKLASGFEMLYQESKNRSDATSNTAQVTVRPTFSSRKDALRRDPEYVSYVERLRSGGYFGSEVPESNLWKTLENKAAAAYVDSRKEDDVRRPSFASKMNAALKAAGDIDFSKCPEEGSDNWLDVGAEDFNLQNMEPGRSSGVDTMGVDRKEEELVQDQALKLKSLAQKIEKFVEGEGDLDGALFDDDDADDDFSEGMPDSDVDSDPEAGADVDDAAKSQLVPGLELGEYGKMPPLFYANSQKVGPNPETEKEPPNEPVVDEDKEPPQVMRPIRPPILPRDKFDGVDSDDETDEDELPVWNEDSDEDHPELVGEVEPDMNEEEEEFLAFSRKALGISNEQWNDIINERKNRGAFVPHTITLLESKPQASEQPQNGGGTNIWSQSANGSNTGKNAALDSFESVMQAMDVELARSRPSNGKHKPSAMSKEKGKGKATEAAIPVDGDIDAAMDAELKALLGSEGLGDESDGDEEGGDTGIDYNLIKNFLESFKSQAGLSGPVSNLAGRLQPDFKLPRD